MVANQLNTLTRGPMYGEKPKTKNCRKSTRSTVQISGRLF